MDCSKIIWLSLFIVFSVNVKTSLSQYNKAWSEKYGENNKCPKLFPKNFVNFAPVGKPLIAKLLCTMFV